MVKYHNRLPAASPRLASLTVGRRSAAPSGDAILPEVAAAGRVNEQIAQPFSASADP
jgi:hypothetical protein